RRVLLLLFARLGRTRCFAPRVRLCRRAALVQLAEIPALAVRLAVEPVVPMLTLGRLPVGAGEAILAARSARDLRRRSNEYQDERSGRPFARHPSLPFFRELSPVFPRTMSRSIRA